MGRADKMVIGEDIGKTRSFEVPDGRAWRRDSIRPRTKTSNWWGTLEVSQVQNTKNFIRFSVVKVATWMGARWAFEFESHEPGEDVRGQKPDAATATERSKSIEPTVENQALE